MANISSTGKFIDVLKGIRINAAYKKIEAFLPRWISSRIRSVLNKHAFLPLVIAEEIQPKYEMACNYLEKKIGKNAIGDYLEFGVSHGSSMSIIHKVLQKSKLDRVRLFGFDSFEGMPDIAAVEDKGKWKPGEFASTLEETKKFLAERGADWSRIFLIKGWYSDTLTAENVSKHNINKASIIMIDCDIYSSSIQSLNFCKPLIKDVAIIIFDDWIEDEGFGEYRAWQEFLNANPHFKSEEFGTYKPTGKLFILTNTTLNKS